MTGEIPIYNLPLAFVVAIVMNVLVSLMTRVPTGYGKTNSSIQGVS